MTETRAPYLHLAPPVVPGVARLERLRKCPSVVEETGRVTGRIIDPQNFDWLLDLAGEALRVRAARGKS
jgi:hypothetical protein